MTDCDPIDLWNAIYPYEEPIAIERETIANLQISLDTNRFLNEQIGKIPPLLQRIDEKVARHYCPWAAKASSYRFPMELSLQLRLLSLIENLEKTSFHIGNISIPICVRQIIKPSAFNGSPRIKRFPQVAFIIFPAASTCWMYVIIELILSGLDGGQFDFNRVDEYIRYLLAARSFERWSTPSTAYALDFLIDQLVFGPQRINENSWEAQVTALSANMISAAESFILCHEVAHLSLGHQDEGNSDVEADADRLALSMLQALDAKKVIMITEHEGLNAEALPLLGYLTLRLWTMIRLSAEMRILPYVMESAAEVEVMRRDIGRKFDARLYQVQKMGSIKNIPVPPLFRSIVKASEELAKNIREHPIERSKVDEVRRLAKSLALDEHGLLTERLYTDARIRRSQQGASK